MGTTRAFNFDTAQDLWEFFKPEKIFADSEGQHEFIFRGQANSIYEKYGRKSK